MFVPTNVAPEKVFNSSTLYPLSARIACNAVETDGCIFFFSSHFLKFFFIIWLKNRTKVNFRKFGEYTSIIQTLAYFVMYTIHTFHIFRTSLLIQSTFDFFIIRFKHSSYLESVKIS